MERDLSETHERELTALRARLASALGIRVDSNDAMVEKARALWAERDRLLWLHAEAVWNWRHLAGRYDDTLRREHALRASAVQLPEDWRFRLKSTLTGCIGDVDELDEAVRDTTMLLESWRPVTVEPASTTPAEPFGVQLMREGMERSSADRRRQRQGVGQTVPHMTPDEEARTFGLAAPAKDAIALLWPDMANEGEDWCGCQSNPIGGQSWHPKGDETCIHAAGVSGTGRVEPGEVIGAKDVLTPAMQRHLVELLAAPHWHPETAGEWSTARALERRGYLRANVSQGHQPYSLTDKGREAAEALNSGAGVSVTGTGATDATP